MKKQIGFLLKWIAGLTILGYILYRIGIKDILTVFKDLNYSFLPLVVIIFILNFIVGTLNISILVTPLKHIRFWTLLKYHVLSWSIGLFIPSKIGELSIVYLFNKKGVGYGQGLAISIIDKVITILALFLIAVFGVMFQFNFKMFINVFLIFILIFIILYFLIISDMGRKLIKKYILRRYATYFNGFYKTISYYLKERRKRLVLNFFITSIKWLLSALIIWLLFYSFNLQVNYLYILLISAVITLFTFIPVSISGLGIREGVAVYFFGMKGIAGDVVVGVFLVVLVINYTIATLCIMFFSKELKQVGSRNEGK